MIDGNFPKTLRKRGINVVELPGWQTRKADSRLFKPIGVMSHHTATSPAASIGDIIDAVVKNNYYNVVVDRDGTVYVVAAGRMWHAGRGSNNVLELQRQGKAPEGDATSAGIANGNEHYYGVAITNRGTTYSDGSPVEPVPEAQWKSLVEVNYALQVQLGNTNANTSIHHREWTNRKVDILHSAGDLRGDISKLFYTPPKSFQLDDSAFWFPNPGGKGFYYSQADGGIFAVDGATYHGSLPGLGVTPNSPIIDGVALPAGNGYYLLGADGGIFGFGAAKYLGSLVGRLDDRGKPVGIDIVGNTVVVYGDILSYGSVSAPYYEVGQI